MYLYIQTPPVNNSNKVAHLVEHCVHNKENLSISEYFNICDIDAETSFWYTKFNLHHFDIKKFIHAIEYPLTNKLIKKELQVLNEELQEKIFTQKIRKITEKALNIKEDNRINYKEIITYHKKYYNKNHYIITDENYDIIQIWIKTIKDTNRKPQILQKIHKRISWEANTLIVLKYSHWKDQIIANFIEILIDTRIEYQERYMKWIYTYQCSSMIEGTNYITIAIPKLQYNIEYEFFDNAKKYYKELLNDWKIRENQIINVLYKNQLPSKAMIQEFIESISYETIQGYITDK